MVTAVNSVQVPWRLFPGGRPALLTVVVGNLLELWCLPASLGVSHGCGGSAGG